MLAVFLAAALLVTACGDDPVTLDDEVPVPAPAPSGNPRRDLASLLESATRPAEDRARDAGRKPAQVLEFLGIEPGMRVIDIMAAGGWYTEVLSLAVGPDGLVVAHNPPAFLEFRDGFYEKALSTRLAGARLPNVTRLDRDVADLKVEDGPFDAALMALNLHDIYNREGEEAAIAAMRGVYAVLKPGGTFGLIDHAGNEGQDNASVHRMLKADAIRVAEAAGFVVAGDSGILHVHSDDRTQSVFADGTRGRTHRFLLKLRKPG